jgi:hypothetical protein
MTDVPDLLIADTGSGSVRGDPQTEMVWADPAPWGKSSPMVWADGRFGFCLEKADGERFAVALDNNELRQVQAAIAAFMGGERAKDVQWLGDIFRDEKKRQGIKP